MINWPQLKYHKKQTEYCLSRRRFNFLPCGRQSGKTELAMRKLVMYLAVKKPWSDPRYFFGSPTYRQVKKVAWRRFLSLIPAEWMADISHSELNIRTTFGSELFLIGLDKPERAEGLLIDGGIVDENSDIKPKTFDLSILPSLVHRNGFCDFIGVPKRHGKGAAEYKDKCEKAGKGELPDSALFVWPSEGIVPKDYLELCRATMDSRDFDEQFNASWVSTSGGIFHAFDEEYNVRPCLYNPNQVLIITSDFNVDPMAWLIGHERGEVFEVIDELFIRNTNTPATLDELFKRYSSHKGGFRFYGDASSQSRHASAYQTDYNHIANDTRFKKLGRSMHYIKSNPPIADRFACTNARICNGVGERNLYITPKCKNLIRDLNSRAYKPGTRDTDDSGDIGHISDALGYYLYKRFPLRLIIPVSSGKVGITQGT